MFSALKTSLKLGLKFYLRILVCLLLANPSVLLYKFITLLFIFHCFLEFPLFNKPYISRRKIFRWHQITANYTLTNCMASWDRTSVNFIAFNINPVNALANSDIGQHAII